VEPETIGPGDRVRLRGGELLMTVVAVFYEGSAETEKALCSIQKGAVPRAFAIADLERVRP
jgi:hypothetical protein